MKQPSWIGHELGGRYKIEDLLGQGGMSAVYRAYDPNLKRPVAVKLIHTHLTDDPEFVTRFEIEASAVAQLRHPNIIQVFDFDHDEETYYMVLEFIPGETLFERLKRLNQSKRRMSVEEIIQVGSGVAEAVDYAHKRGMIHRDIKPANVMINVQGDVILTDFGIAKIVGGQHQTATGAVVGTALYMSPEQIRGETPDHRVDIYSLGVMLFEMAAGKPPFNADSAMTIMMMHLNDPVPSVRELNPDLPAGIISVLEKALAKNRDARYQSAAELAAALRAAPEVKEAPPAPATVRPPPRTVTAKETVVEPPVIAPPASKPEPVQPSPPLASQPQVLPSSQVQATPAQAGMPPSSIDQAIPVPPPARKQGVLARMGLPLVLLLGGGGVIGVGIVAVLLFSLFGGSTPLADQTSPTVTPSEVPAAAVRQPPTATDAVASATLAPAASPTAAPVVTDTLPPGFHVRILDIRLDGNTYVVDYETYGYVEALPGMHVHFFFDTVTQEQAGFPGKGPWVLYGGPQPFTSYSVSDKPAAAEQMCALVALVDHSVILDSGNCLPLP